MNIGGQVPNSLQEQRLHQAVGAEAQVLDNSLPNVNDLLSLIAMRDAGGENKEENKIFQAVAQSEMAYWKDAAKWIFGKREDPLEAKYQERIRRLYSKDIKGVSALATKLKQQVIESEERTLYNAVAKESINNVRTTLGFIQA